MLHNISIPKACVVLLIELDPHYVLTIFVSNQERIPRKIPNSFLTAKDKHKTYCAKGEGFIPFYILLLFIFYFLDSKQPPKLPLLKRPHKREIQPVRAKKSSGNRANIIRGHRINIPNNILRPLDRDIQNLLRGVKKRELVGCFKRKGKCAN